jgi:hypothetical protein
VGKSDSIPFGDLIRYPLSIPGVTCAVVGIGKINREKPEQDQLVSNLAPSSDVKTRKDVDLVAVECSPDRLLKDTNFFEERRAEIIQPTLPDGRDERVTLTCSFLFSCAGYYRYSAGYTPEFPGASRFRGRLVHPQAWPEDLDYAGKCVVIIGSGATAVTLLPAIAEAASHVTMLQRSPTYVVSIPGRY